MLGHVTVSVYDETPKHPLVESAALTVIGKLPDWVVVPARWPVVGLSVIPLGSAPVSLQATVPRIPETVKVTSRALPDAMLFVAGLVIVMLWQLMVRLYCAPEPWQPFASVAVSGSGKPPTC